MAGLLEGEAQHPLDALAREDGGLHGHLVGRPHMRATARADVLALAILADAQDVEIRLAQGAAHAGQDAVWPQVDILLEAAADLQQHGVQGHMIRHQTRVADGAQEDGLKPPQRLEAVGGHHLPVPRVVRAAPGEVRRVELEAVPLPRGVQDGQRGRYNLDANAIAWDDGDGVRTHGHTYPFLIP